MAKTTARQATNKAAQKSDQKTTTKKAAAPQTTQKTSQKSSPTTTRATTQTTTLRTTEKSGTQRSARSRGDVTVLGLPLAPWTASMRRAKGADARAGKRAFILAFGSRNPKVMKSVLGQHLSKWQLSHLLDGSSESSFYQGSQGPVWILCPQAPAEEGGVSSAQALEKSRYARFRDLAGPVVGALGTYQPDKLILETRDLTLAEERGIIVGLELASYAFQENRVNGGKTRRKLPALIVKESSAQLNDLEIRAAAELGLAMNVARQFTNLPPNDLNPRTYAETIADVFDGSDSVTVDVWEGQKLVQERMNLLLAVGGAALEGPRMVHIRYRPDNAIPGVRPMAFVGKGITFDSGGLDIKPSSGMRWMKKDMGGSAAVVGLAQWAERTRFPMPLDFYVSLAENAVGSRSFRPGDVITARNGMSVEISNTDAEGRLVLADALDVAVTQDEDNMPTAVINVATLTGAIKVALGGEIAGLFSNHDDLATLLADSGLATGDLMWRMPLFQPYRSMLKSTFADFLNCSEGGFGGSISAALFLESFVRKTPWAHLDIYAWKDSGSGAWAEMGGSGQAVQALSEALTRLARGQAQAAAATETTEG